MYLEDNTNCKKLEDNYREYNKLNRIRYCMHLNKELMHASLSHIIRW